MYLSQLEFGALLSYAPRGDSPEIRHSKDVMIALKKDGFVGEPPILMSQWVARAISNQDEFDKLYVPCVGTIELRESGDTLRRP